MQHEDPLPKIVQLLCQNCPGWITGVAAESLRDQTALSPDNEITIIVPPEMFRSALILLGLWKYQMELVPFGAVRIVEGEFKIKLTSEHLSDFFLKCRGGVHTCCYQPYTKQFVQSITPHADQD